MITDSGQDFWKWNPHAAVHAKEIALRLDINLHDDLRIPDNALYTEEDVDNAVKEIEQMENEEWLRIVGGMFYQPPQRTTNNRKKKQRRK